MRLGNLDLKLRKPDEFVRASLLRAYRNSTEPDRSLVVLAALGLHVHGPPDWPTMRPGLDYAGYGDLLRDYLSARRIEHRRGLLLGIRAIEAITQEPETITDEEARAYADFFGVPRDGSQEPDSPTDTRDQPSAD